METRNANITLEKAKEWYKKGGDLKEVALQAFTEEELMAPKFANIKTFTDACEALNIKPSIIEVTSIPVEEARHMSAIYKLDIIRRALNEDWKPSLVQGSVYYPYVRFYPAGQKAREVVSEHKEWKLGESLIADGKEYTLVGGICDYCCFGGLTNFWCKWGYIHPYSGLLGCKSKEIAEHMSRYFSKEIFEATYANHVGTYQWV